MELPGKGRWDDVPTPTSIPVRTQTALDEILLRNPDSLFNGDATVKSIESSFPSIVSAWNVRMSDIHAIFVAIRVVNQGNSLEFEVTCQQCNNMNSHDINLQALLSQVSQDVSQWDNPLVIHDNDMVIYNIKFKPLTYRQHTNFELQDFRIKKTLWQINLISQNGGNIQDHEDLLKNLLKERSELHLSRIIANISEVIVTTKLSGLAQENSQISVTDQKYIKEWLQNSNHELLDQITSHITNKLLPINQLEAIDVTCRQCQHVQKTILDLDWSSSFRSRILTKTTEEVEEIIQNMEKDVKSLQKDLLRIVWYMRGGVSITEAQDMSNQERKIIADIIKENMDNTNRYKVPFI